MSARRWCRWWVGLMVWLGLILLAWQWGDGPVYPTQRLSKSLPLKKNKTRAVLQFRALQDCIPPDVLGDYLHKFGVDVQLTEFAQDTDLYQDLERGQRFDLIMPTGFLTKRLIENRVLAKLQVKGLANVSPADRSIYTPAADPGHEYSVPYLWAALGIAYNSERVPSIPRQWSDLFEATNEIFRGRIVIYNDPRYALGCALLNLKYSPETGDQGQIEQAARLFASLRPYVKGFEIRNTAALLAKGEALLALAASPDAAQAMADNPAIRFVVPEESIVMCLSLAIPATSRQQGEAERFLKYLLRPEVAARVSNFSNYAAADRAARAFVRRELINGPAYAGPAPGHEHQIQFRGDAAEALAEKLWQELSQLP